MPTLAVAPTFLLAFGTLVLACEHDSIAGFWPANSVVVALLLQTRSNYRWIAVGAGLLALVCARLLAGCSLEATLLLSAVNGVEIVACVGLVWLFTRDALDPSQPSHCLGFLLSAGVLAPITSALFAGWYMWAARGLAFFPTVSSWYVGDALGLVAMTPVLVAISQVSIRLWRRHGLI